MEHPVRRQDGLRLLDLMAELTGEGAEMWGPTIVGFGALRALQVRDRPRGGHARRRLLAPEGQPLPVRPDECAGIRGDCSARLGRHKTGAGCLYVNKLADVDEAVLTELIRLGYRY